MELYEGKELIIDGMKGYIRQMFDDNKDDYQWVIFKAYKGSSFVYQHKDGKFISVSRKEN